MLENPFIPASTGEGHSTKRVCVCLQIKCNIATCCIHKLHLVFPAASHASDTGFPCHIPVANAAAYRQILYAWSYSQSAAKIVSAWVIALLWVLASSVIYIS